ncbi:hypothetical protein EK904_015040, partial [Melospiza melodia maxima]
TGPANVTILNITKHSALVKWTEIPAEDRLGFLQGYRISYTDSSRKKSPDKGELEGFVIGLCFSMVLILVFAPLTCSLVIKRLKISYWHSVPTPGNSTALQD